MNNKLIAPAGLLMVAAMFAFVNNGEQTRQLSFNPDSGTQHRKLQSTYDTTVAPVPDAYAHVGNVWDPVVATDQPVFWYLAKCGGATFSTVVAKCLGVVQCSPKGDSTGKTIPPAPVS